MKPYIKSLTVNRRKVDAPVIRHENIEDGGEIVFEMSETVKEWGNALLVGFFLFLVVCLTVYGRPLTLTF